MADRAAWQPVPPAGFDAGPQMLPQQFDRLEIPCHCDQNRRSQARACCPNRQALTACAASMHQIPTDGERARRHQREQRRHDQVVRDGRRNAQQLDRNADHHETIVVVVDVAAGEPRIVRRERGALEYRGQVCQVHRLFTAAERVPQVRVGHADQQERDEEDGCQYLDAEEIAPALAEKPAEGAAIVPNNKSPGCRHASQGGGDDEPIDGDSERSGQPDRIRQQQQSRRLGHWIAAVAQARKRQPDQRKRR